MLAGGLMARSAAAAEPADYTPAFEPPAEYPSAPQAPEAAGSAAPPGWASARRLRRQFCAPPMPRRASV